MKKLIIGLVIGLLMGMSTNAFAAIGDKVQAVFAEFNYVVNGESTTIDSPVLVYEGTSYVRTTDLSNMLGYDVTYKKDSRTIAFTSDESTEQSVTDATYEPDPTATPDPSATPTPSGTPDVSPTPTPDPNATPGPSATPEPTASATPTPEPTPAPAGQTNEHAILCRSLPVDSGAYIANGCY